MIANETFTKEWIESFRRKREYRKVDSALIEKMIYALLLAEKLTETGIEFVFKGATSLVLLVKNINRFSVDVDIIAPIKRDDLEKSFDKIIENSPFISWELDEKRSFANVIPKAHYIFTYNAIYNKSVAIILLDVIFDTIPFTKLVEVNIDCLWIKTDRPLQKINVPSVNGILGDKLTAFAPNTIGIPYQKNKELEIIKQLNDINILFSHVPDLEEVYLNNVIISKKQFKYLGKEELTIKDVYEDIYNTSIILAKAFKNRDADLTRFNELMKGISVINHFLITGHFRLVQAQIASAKAAYITTKLGLKDFSPLIFFNNGIDLKNIDISNTVFGYIQRFKKTNKQAFFYFYHCLKLRGLSD